MSLRAPSLLSIVVTLSLLPLHVAFMVAPPAPLTVAVARLAVRPSPLATRVRGTASVVLMKEEPAKEEEEEDDSLYAQGFDFEFDVSHAWPSPRRSLPSLSMPLHLR